MICKKVAKTLWNVFCGNGKRQNMKVFTSKLGLVWYSDDIFWKQDETASEYVEKWTRWRLKHKIPKARNFYRSRRTPSAKAALCYKSINNQLLIFN